MASESNFKYVNPFIMSAITVIKETTDVGVAKKRIYSTHGKVSMGGVGIILDITGDIKGKVVYEFSREITMRLSSKMIEKSMIKFDDPENFKSLLESAIKELSNLISGKAITILSELGYNCMITPPKIFLGKGTILVPRKDQAIVIDLRSGFGDFTINLSIARVGNRNVKVLAGAK